MTVQFPQFQNQKQNKRISNSSDIIPRSSQSQPLNSVYLPFLLFLQQLKIVIQFLIKFSAIKISRYHMRNHIYSQSSSTLLKTPQPNCRLDFTSADPSNLHFQHPRSKPKLDRTTLTCTINRVARCLSKQKHQCSYQGPIPSCLISPKHKPSPSKSLKYKLLTPHYIPEALKKDKDILGSMHPQALEFLKRNFSGCNSRSISMEVFLERLICDYKHLWDEEAALLVLPELVERLRGHLGQGYVDLDKFHGKTKRDGLVGMILTTLREIEPAFEIPGQNQNPQLQNIMNVLQQFIQGLLAEAQKQLYNKLTCQMRKLVVKYRQTESLLQRLNEKYTQNIDKIQSDKILIQTRKQYQATIDTLKQKIMSYQTAAEKNNLTIDTLRTDNKRLQQQCRKLSETVQKFQDHLLKSSGSQIDQQPNKFGQSPRKYEPLELLRYQTRSKPDFLTLHTPTDFSTTRFRCNFSSVFPLTTPADNIPPLHKNKDSASILNELKQQDNRKHQHRKNIEVYELKKQISSFLDGSQNSKQKNSKMNEETSRNKMSRSKQARAGPTDTSAEKQS